MAYRESFTLHHILVLYSNEEEWDWQKMYIVWGRREIHTKFWLEILKGRYYSEDLVVDGG
jgi:hypothetical protein